MEETIQFVSVPIIAAMVYGAMMMYKYAFYEKESLVRLIPVFSTLLGCVLGIISFYAIPDIMPAENIFSAIIIGGTSGLAATGTHQVLKQLQKNDGDFFAATEETVRVRPIARSEKKDSDRECTDDGDPSDGEKDNDE